MENNKKNLAKKAFAALVLAASLPVAGHAAAHAESSGTLLAGGCGQKSGGACQAVRNSSYSQRPSFSCNATSNRNYYNTNERQNGYHAATSSSSVQSSAPADAMTAPVSNPYNAGNYQGGSYSSYETNGRTYNGSNDAAKPMPATQNPSAPYNGDSEMVPANPHGGSNNMNHMNNWNR